MAQAAKGEPENYLIVGVDTREGQAASNTDTIMVVRIDPESDRVALTSFPRDLMVTIADTGESRHDQRRLRPRHGGEQELIDTIKQNFDITINHYVEVNFDSFQQVVDAVGGVPIWIPYAVRDHGSGFYPRAGVRQPRRRAGPGLRALGSSRSRTRTATGCRTRSPTRTGYSASRSSSSGP